MRKSSFILLSMGIGAIGVFVACSSSNSNGGGSSSGGTSSSSSSGGTSSGTTTSSSSGGGYTFTNCPNANAGGLAAACVSCIETSCTTELANINTACASTFDCACPLGVDASSCVTAASTTCLAAIETASTQCTACASTCGSTSSSSSGGSSSSGSSSGGDDAGCAGVTVTARNVDTWCTITVSGTNSVGGISYETPGATASICVSPNSPVTFSATANAGFVLGTWNDTANSPGTDGGTEDAGAILTTTVTVGDAGTSACAWICCPGTGANAGLTCPTTQTGCPQ